MTPSRFFIITDENKHSMPMNPDPKDQITAEAVHDLEHLTGQKSPLFRDIIKTVIEKASEDKDKTIRGLHRILDGHDATIAKQSEIIRESRAAHSFAEATERKHASQTTAWEDGKSYAEEIAAHAPKVNCPKCGTPFHATAMECDNGHRLVSAHASEPLLQKCLNYLMDMRVDGVNQPQLEALITELRAGQLRAAHASEQEKWMKNGNELYKGSGLENFIGLALNEHEAWKIADAHNATLRQSDDTKRLIKAAHAVLDSAEAEEGKPPTWSSLGELNEALQAIDAVMSQKDP